MYVTGPQLPVCPSYIVQIWTVAPGIGCPFAESVTVPRILPHDGGGVTFMVTVTGVTWYGVSVPGGQLRGIRPGLVDL